MILYHRQQPQVWGCIYHALYAATGNEELLEHVDDLSDLRALVRLHRLGLGVQVLHAALLGGAQPTTQEFWDEVMSNVEPQGCIALLTVAASQPGLLHAVAALIRPDEVEVSDSALEEPQLLTRDAFLRSRYAQAFEVQVLFALDLDALPVFSAPEFMAERQAAEDDERAVQYAM